MLKIINLSVKVESKLVVRHLHLHIKTQETHVLMGPNGSGKSSLAYALAGHPHYQLSPSSQIILNRRHLTHLPPHLRSQAGLFLAFQYPVVIPGVSVQNFLQSAYSHLYPQEKLSVRDFRHHLQLLSNQLHIEHQFLERSLHDGFSGGEKKRIEILQMLCLKPQYAILDETDSGLDIDSIKIIAQGIQSAIKTHKTGVIVITHYQRILNYLNPQYIHIMLQGKIIKTGGPELAQELEKVGYSHLKK